MAIPQIRLATIVSRTTDKNGEVVGEVRPEKEDGNLLRISECTCALKEMECGICIWIN
jgi:hypothetical protein